MQQPENQRRKHPGCQQYICGACGPVLEGTAIGCLSDGLGQAGQHGDAGGRLAQLCLRHQHFEQEHGRAGYNLILPDELNEIEWRILKEAFRQARKLQARLKLDYQL